MEDVESQSFCERSTVYSPEDRSRGVSAEERSKHRLVTSFHNQFKLSPAPPCSWRKLLSQKLGHLCEKKWWLKALQKNFPFIRILRRYSLKEDFPNDLVSGLTVGIMQIPQSMAYAMLASLPPICGLYTALFAPIIYFFLGSSRHISMGIIAIVSLMIGTVLDREVGLDDNELITMTWNASNGSDTSNGDISDRDIKKIQVATALSFLSGLFMILFGKLGLGIVTSYMSESLVSGFTTGAATHVITSQVKHVFGLKVQRYNGAFKVIKTWIAFFSAITSTNFASLIMSLVCMVFLYLVKIQVNQRFKSRLKIPIPIELIVVILGTVASHFGYFNAKYNVDIVKDIPAGMPSPSIPDIWIARNCIADAIIIGIVAFAQSVSMAKIFAKKNNYKIDSNQEMVGYGAGSVFASLFSGYITAASVARSSVQESAGGKTQVASIFSCIIVFVVVMAVGPLFYNLPTCVLAAVIIVSLRSLFLQVFDLRPLWRISKYDFAIWVVTFLGVVILDADYGLGIGILFSLLTVVIRTQRANMTLVGEVEKTDVFRPISSYDQVRKAKDVVILYYSSSLYFANADRFVNNVHKSLGLDPRKAKRRLVSKGKSRENDVQETRNTGDHALTNAVARVENVPVETSSEFEMHHVIIDCSGINFVDSMGVKALKEVIQDYDSIDIEVVLANCTDEIIDVFKSTDFWKKYEDRIFLNLQGAVATAAEKMA